MRRNILKLGAGLAALSVLALGGSALASAGHKATPSSPPAATAPATQSNDAEVKASAEQPGVVADTDTIQDENGPDTATGAVDTESKDAAEPVSSAADKADATDATDSGRESSTEVADNDGPGGHADEPGNANADHQAIGNE